MSDYASPNYQQPVKAEARNRLLKHAVRTLTLDRRNSAVIRLHELSSILSYAEWFLRNAGAPLNWLDGLSEEITVFEGYLNDSRLGAKQPRDLRVLYLCGPEPYNDLNILLELGCRPENIWGIERDKTLYGQAVAQLTAKGAPIKVHRGSLAKFFEIVNISFDLVYIDGCGPFLGGDPKSTGPLLELFSQERLADFAMLITNYSEIPKEHETAYVSAMAHYFGPRYNDVPIVLHQDGFDPADSALDPTEATRWIKRRMDDCYSDFITRLTIDLCRHIVPISRIGSFPDIRGRFFTDEKAFEEILAVPNVEIDLFELMRSNNVHLLGLPLLSFLLRSKDYTDTDRLLEPIRSYALNGVRIDKAYPRFAVIENVLEGYFHLASPEFLAAIRVGWFDSTVPYFCDAPLPHLTFQLLTAMYGHP